MTGPMRSTKRRCPAPGAMADGDVVVLVVVAGVHVLPLLAMPQLLGDVGRLVPVQLGVMAVGVGHGEPLPRGLSAC
jgi:hypothetical protein